MDDDDNSLEYEEQVKVSLNIFMDCYDEYMKIELSNPTKAQVKEMTILSGQIGSIIEEVNMKVNCKASKLAIIISTILFVMAILFKLLDIIDA